MLLPVTRANEVSHPVAKGNEAEEVSLLFGGETEDEGRGNVTVKMGALARIARDLQATRETRRIHDNVNFLRLFKLKNFCDRVSPPRGGFPVDGIEAVTGNVLAQLLEIAALSHLPNGLRSTVACSQEDRGALFANGFPV